MSTQTKPEGLEIHDDKGEAIDAALDNFNAEVQELTRKRIAHAGMIEKIKEEPLSEGEIAFCDQLTVVAESIHEDNRKKGFHDRDPRIEEAIKLLYDTNPAAARSLENATIRNPIEMLGLTVTELAEAIEATRTDAQDDHLPMFPGEVVEVADAIIRELDFCHSRGYGRDIGLAIVYKLRYNRLRPHKHGKKV